MFGFAEPPQQCGVNFPLCSLISLSFYRLREIRSRTVELCVITGAVFLCVKLLATWYSCQWLIHQKIRLSIEINGRINFSFWLGEAQSDKKKKSIRTLVSLLSPWEGAGRGRHACVSAEGRNGTIKNKNRKRYRPNLDKELLQRITSHRN